MKYAMEMYKGLDPRPLPLVGYVINGSTSIYTQCYSGVFSSSQERNHSVTLKEIQVALQKSKNVKSVGPDLIGNEMIKYRGEHLHRSLLKLFNTILNAGKYPEKWKDSIITPIHKGLDAHKPENHKGVAVADCISKIFSNIILFIFKQFYYNFTIQA